jgi:hypothetical protein
MPGKQQQQQLQHITLLLQQLLRQYFGFLLF